MAYLAAVLFSNIGHEKVTEHTLVQAGTKEAGPADNGSSAGELLKAAVDVRRGLSRGHVVLQHEVTRDPQSREPGFSHYGDIRRRYDIYFDEGKVRSVVDWQHPRWTKTSRTVVDGSNYIVDSDDRLPIRTGKYEGTPPHECMEAFQPRLLGLLLDHPSRWYTGTIDSVRARAQDRPIAPVAERVDGEDALRAEFVSRAGDRTRLWFAPRFGDSIIRIEISINKYNSKIVSTSHYTNVGRGGLWFPDRVVRQTISKGEVREEDVFTVEKAEFGIEIDPALFGLVRLGIAPGRRVLMSPDNRLMVWTGQRLRMQVVGEFGNEPPEVKPGPHQVAGIGQPFELNFTDAIKGEKVSVDGLTGKVVIIDFWATWCAPCIAEISALKELYAKYRGQGVEFIGVSLDEPEAEGGLAKLKAFVTENKLEWPQYYQGKGWESEFSRAWDIVAIPTVFVVDRRGRLASVDARGHLETVIKEELARQGDSRK